MTFTHPETGEVLDSREDFLGAMLEVEQRLTPVYHELWALRDAYTERYPVVEQPAARYRTPTQEKVARCPRCGGKLDQSLGTS